MEEIIYVLAKDGEPLMPTKRKRYITKLLNTGRARIVSKIPFVVQLKYEPKTRVVQPMTVSIDPGRTNIGASVEKDDGTVAYRDKVQTRNEEIPGLMKNRKQHRQTSRRGERQVKKRKAKRNKTLSTKLPPEGKKIAGCKDLVPVKDINNAEVRFRNRKRHGYTVSNAGWLTPTANQLVQTHISHISQLCRIMPIDRCCIETNRFAFMLMVDGTVRGTDFQNGRMKDYKSVEDYVIARQNGICPLCGGKIDDVHHIIPVSQGGSDRPENRIGVCNTCHSKIHTGELKLNKEGLLKKYGALSVLNQAIPYIALLAQKRFGSENVFTCTGYETSMARKALGFPKDHDIDSICIFYACTKIQPTGWQNIHCYELQQFRRHDRAIINNQRERTYYIADDSAKGGKKIVAKNRKPRFEQKKSKFPALSQFAEAGGDIAKLSVVKSSRRYNNPDREWHPGDKFNYLGKEYTVSAQQNNGQYLKTFEEPKMLFITRKVRRTSYNKGLVYIH